MNAKTRVRCYNYDDQTTYYVRSDRAPDSMAEVFRIESDDKPKDWEDFQYHRVPFVGY